MKKILTDIEITWKQSGVWIKVKPKNMLTHNSYMNGSEIWIDSDWNFQAWDVITKAKSIEQKLFEYRVLDRISWFNLSEDYDKNNSYLRGCTRNGYELQNINISTLLKSVFQDIYFSRTWNLYISNTKWHSPRWWFVVIYQWNDAYLELERTTQSKQTVTLWDENYWRKWLQAYFFPAGRFTVKSKNNTLDAGTPVWFIYTF